MKSINFDQCTIYMDSAAVLPANQKPCRVIEPEVHSVDVDMKLSYVMELSEINRC